MIFYHWSASIANCLIGFQISFIKMVKIDSAFADCNFDERFARVIAQYPELIDRMNISLPLENGVKDADNFHAHTGAAVFGLLRNAKILDVVESIIGPEVASSPVQQNEDETTVGEFVR